MLLILLLISLAVLVWFIDSELDARETSLPLLHGCCPNCRRDVESGWLLCPDCRCILRSCCAGCGRVHDRWVRYCPWCGQEHTQSRQVHGGHHAQA